MATRNGTLQLGLVSAPIKLDKATTSNDVKLSICGPNGEKVKQAYVLADEHGQPTDQILGSRENCAKSFEGTVIPEEAIRAINDESKIEEGVDISKVMLIKSFIPLKTVPFQRVTACYYVMPDMTKGTPTAYSTILGAMRKKKMAAVVKYIPTSREQLLVFYVENDVMYAVEISFAADVKPVPHGATEHQSVKPPARLIDQAMTLIEEYSDDGLILDEITDKAVDKRLGLIESYRSTKQVGRAPKAKPIGLDSLEAALAASVKASTKATKKKVKVGNA